MSDYHIALLIIAFLAGPWTIICVRYGFRMGRQSIDKPLEPIIQKKQAAMVEEDPWYKPMTGEDQPSYPTVDR